MLVYTEGIWTVPPFQTHPHCSKRPCSESVETAILGSPYQFRDPGGLLNIVRAPKSGVDGGKLNDQPSPPDKFFDPRMVLRFVGFTTTLNPKRN